MNISIVSRLKNYPDKVLLDDTLELVKKERVLITDILYHLREIERRRLFSILGYSSLYSYCTQHLGYSESQAHYRITAMRMIKQLPEIESKLNKGELTLSSVSKVQSFIRSEEKVSDKKISLKQKKELLNKISNQSVRECEKTLIAQSSQPHKRIKPDQVKVVAPKTIQVQFTANEKLLEKIERLKGLLAHKHPQLNYEELINILCETTLDKIDPLRKKIRKDKKMKSTCSSKAECGMVNTKRTYISVDVKRSIWQRAQGKCEICESQFALELDHIKPKCHGGTESIKNLRLTCRSCNQRQAIEKVGQKTMNAYLDNGLLK